MYGSLIRAVFTNHYDLVHGLSTLIRIHVGPNLDSNGCNHEPEWNWSNNIDGRYCEKWKVCSKYRRCKYRTGETVPIALIVSPTPAARSGPGTSCYKDESSAR
jgi:hypothetical protein